MATYCPDWAKRVDELSSQIDQRQIDLADLAERQSASAYRKSLNRRGSTQSLKPTDDGDAHPGFEQDENDLSKPDGLANGLQHDSEQQTPTQTTPLQPSQPQTNGLSTADEPDSPTPSVVERQTPQVKAVASANARATLRRTRFAKPHAVPVAESMLTGDGAAAPKYNSRSLVIVYYDSYVQSSFEEVVKFVSASRNLMRKAKMAARVAQIKRLAELDAPDNDSDSDEAPGFGGFGTARLVPPMLSASPVRVDEAAEVSQGELKGGGENNKGQSDHPLTAAEAKPKPVNGERDGTVTVPNPRQPSYNRFYGSNSNGIRNGGPSPHLSARLRPSATAWASTRPSYGKNGISDPQQPRDVFDDLDKGLDDVQSMCERAAHQFLRDGDCAEEIVKIKERLTDTKALADKEMQRILDGDADGTLKKMLADGTLRNRTFRSQGAGPGRDSMRLRPTFAVSTTTPMSTSRSGYKPMHMGSGITNGHSPALVPDFKPVELGPRTVTLEVDEAITAQSMAAELPRPKYDSTRITGPPVITGS